MNRDLRELQDKIGYQFQEWKLFRRAMTHSSFANEHHMDKLDCNERLEFLGDAVLELVSSDFLYREYSERLEGELTKIRASVVCEPTLAYCASEIGLGDYLLLGRGEEATGGRHRDSVSSVNPHWPCVPVIFLWEIICFWEKGKRPQEGVREIPSYPMPWRH